MSCDEKMAPLDNEPRTIYLTGDCGLRCIISWQFPPERQEKHTLLRHLPFPVFIQHKYSYRTCPKIKQLHALRPPRCVPGRSSLGSPRRGCADFSKLGAARAWNNDLMRFIIAFICSSRHIGFTFVDARALRCCGNHQQLSPRAARALGSKHERVLPRRQELKRSRCALALYSSAVRLITQRSSEQLRV